MLPAAASEYDRLKSKTLLEVCRERAALQYSDALTDIMTLVYEEKLMEQQHNFNKLQIELQHQHNKENIELQHDLNKQLFDKQQALLEQQVKAMNSSTKITAATALIAALAGVLLGHMINKQETPLQIKLDLGQVAQLQTANTVSVAVPKPKVDKVPYSSPYKKPTINSNEKGPAGRLETRP